MIKFIVLIMLFTTSIFAATLRVSSVDKKEITNGDILEVNLSSDISIDWQDLLEKRIGNILYVMEVDAQSKMIASAKVMALPPVDNNDSGTIKIAETEFSVEIVGIKANFSKQTNLPEYIFLDSSYDISSSKNLKNIAILIVILLFIFLIINPIKKIRYKQKQKKVFNKKQIEIKATLENAKIREDFENIYSIKSDLKEYFIIDDKAFREYIKSMNTILYLKDWNEENFTFAKSSLKKLKSELRDKSGI